MKTENLTNFNGDPGKVSCIIKVDKDVLSEHTKSRESTSATNIFECFLHSSVGDTITLHIEADASTADFFDIYCDGILRFTQPNPNHEKKSKVEVKKVYHMIKGSNKKSSDGVKLCDMEIQARDKSHDIDDFTNSSAVGTITVKCWQKLQIPGVSNDGDMSEPFPSFANHHEWHDLDSNVRMDMTSPELQLGFTKPRNVSKTAKSGTLAEDVEAAAKRDPMTFLHFCSLVFHIRTTAELKALGFDVSERSKTLKPGKKSKKVTIADQDEDELEEDDEDNVHEEVRPLPEAVLRMLLPFFEVDSSCGQDIEDAVTETPKFEAHPQIDTVPEASNSTTTSSVNHLDKGSTSATQGLCSITEELPRQNEITSFTMPFPDESRLFLSTQNPKGSATTQAAITGIVSNVDEVLDPKRQSPDNLAEQVENSQANVSSIFDEPEPADEHATAHNFHYDDVAIEDSKVPNNTRTESHSTKQSRVLKGLACAPAMEAYRKRNARLAREQSVDLDVDENPTIDVNESLENESDDLSAQIPIPPSFLITPPGTAKKSDPFATLLVRPSHIDSELDLTKAPPKALPKTFSQATTATWSQSVRNSSNAKADADPIVSADADDIIVVNDDGNDDNDDTRTEIAPEEDMLRAIDASRLSRDLSPVSNMDPNEDSLITGSSTRRLDMPAADIFALNSQSRIDKVFLPEAINNRLFAEMPRPTNVLSMFTDPTPEMIGAKPTKSRSSAHYRASSAGSSASNTSTSAAANKRSIKRSSLPDPRGDKTQQKAQNPTAARSFLSRDAAQNPAEEKGQDGARGLENSNVPRHVPTSSVTPVIPLGLPATVHGLKESYKPAHRGSQPIPQATMLASQPNPGISASLGLTQSNVSIASTKLPGNKDFLKRIATDYSFDNRPQKSQKIGQMSHPSHSQASLSPSPSADIPQGTAKNTARITVQPSRSGGFVSAATYNDLDAKYRASEAKLKEVEASTEKTRQHHAKLRMIKQNREKADQLAAEQAQLQREIDEMEGSF